jgi:hypothetical protein
MRLAASLHPVGFADQLRKSLICACDLTILSPQLEVQEGQLHTTLRCCHAAGF